MVKIVKSAVLASENKEIIDKLNEILLRHNYTAITVKTSFDSIIKIFNHTNVDVIILDLDYVTQPDLESIQIIKKLRPKLPIVILTEDNTIETVRYLVQLGVYYVALKPISKTKLEEIIKAVKNYSDMKNNIEKSNKDKTNCSTK